MFRIKSMFLNDLLSPSSRLWRTTSFSLVFVIFLSELCKNAFFYELRGRSQHKFPNLEQFHSRRQTRNTTKYIIPSEYCRTFQKWKSTEYQLLLAYNFLIKNSLCPKTC